MDKLKAVPTFVWIGLGIIIILLVMFFRTDIGNWWEHRKQAKFDKTDNEKQVQIDNLHQQLEAALKGKREAEAREQVKEQESVLLRELIDKRGGRIEEEQKKIEEALAKYKEDTAIIEAAGRGEISKFDLCKRQCDDSAGIGYPCRKNYCDQFIGK